MSKWEKLNKEFDDALNSMTLEDCDNWYQRFEQKRINQNNMTAVEIKNDISVKSRLVGMTDEQLKVIDFIIDYSFKDNQEVYTNGTILVPLFRVLDAISQEGNQYQESC